MGVLVMMAVEGMVVVDVVGDMTGGGLRGGCGERGGRGGVL